MPVWSRLLLRATPLGEQRGDVGADFAELFGDRRERYGRFYAHRRLAADVISLWRPSARGGTMLRDLRFALRLFRKHPIPIGVTVGGLALAIGVASTVFSIVNGAMLRPFAMQDPGSVVMANPSGHGFSIWPYARFLEMKQGSKLGALEASLMHYVRVGATATEAGERDLRLLFVSGGYLGLLGAQPALGRALTPEDDHPSAPPAVMVSHGFWATQLRSDPSMVGQTIWINGAPATLAGVMTEEFSGPTRSRPSIWAPFAFYDEARMGSPIGPSSRTLVEVVGRLAPGVSPAALQENLTTVLRQQTPPSSTSNARPPSVHVKPASRPLDLEVGDEAVTVIAFLSAIVALVLGLAAANTANLLLAGASTRTREIGIRLAMGSTRGRIMRQLLNEGLLIGTLAGLLGVLLAFGLAPLFASVVHFPPEVDVRPDLRVLLFTVAVAACASLIASLSPARFGARGHVLTALKSQDGWAGHSVRPSKLKTSFVGFQAAVSMLLLVVAALFARSALVMARVDVGYDTGKLVGVQFSTPRADFDQTTYLQAALAALEPIPGVERVSINQTQPFGRLVEQDELASAGQSFTLYQIRSDAAYFMTTGIRLLKGRLFTAQEVARSEPVAVISDSVARRFFAAADPLGQSLSAVPSERGNQPHAIIVGVVSDGITASLHTQTYGTIHHPLRPVVDKGETRATPGLVVRASRPGDVAHLIEDALRRIDPRVQTNIYFVQQRLDSFLEAGSMLAFVTAPTALLALVLALMGVYGVTAFVLQQRTHEVSVRMAIGASAADVFRLLMRDSLRPVIVGLAIGLAAAIGVSIWLARQLSGISPQDPMAIAVAAVLLLAGAFAAVVAPTRRAAATNPSSALRQI